MRKRIVLLFLSFFCISMCTYGIDAWIRINQLGYLPNAQKKAVLISKSPLAIKQFAIYDALTNQELGTFKTVTSRGEFENFKNTSGADNPFDVAIPMVIGTNNMVTALACQWCNEFGLQLISPTPKTLSNTDISIPEMRDNYYSSNEIYNNITEIESTQGLNGYILVFHIGSDSKRKDKFYPKLNALLTNLTKEGYEFVDLCTATNMFCSSTVTTDKKQKRKN